MVAITVTPPGTQQVSGFYIFSFSPGEHCPGILHIYSSFIQSRPLMLYNMKMLDVTLVKTKPIIY